MTGQTQNLAVLVGAGSGDAGLLTLEGAYWLSRAKYVVYDRLANPALLELAPPEAQRVYVGKGAHSHAMEQEQINELLVRLVREGGVVVRLKGGDPFVFGRGGEEADALVEAGLAFRVVPGVTAGVAGPAYAGISVTDRRLASSLALVTGHEDPTKLDSSINWSALAGIDTVVFYMGVGHLEQIAQRLIAAGRSPDTPAAVIQNATTPHQRTVAATLATISREAQLAGVKPPAITVVGQVVSMRQRLAWFDKLPLVGRTVLVTRSRKQASELSASLRRLGAEVIEAPTIDIEPPQDWAAVDAALRRLRKFDFLAFTSPNGVEYFMSRLAELGMDARSLVGLKIAAVGPATASALAQRGIKADIVPPEFTTSSLGQAMRGLDLSGKKALLARADIATPELHDMLAAAGAVVEELVVYRTVCPAGLPPQAKDALVERRVDWITFTSSSTVENFLALLKREGLSQALGASEADKHVTRLACIGPVTARTLESHGLRPSVIAKPHTIDALVTAMCESND